MLKSARFWFVFYVLAYLVTTVVEVVLHGGTHWSSHFVNLCLLLATTGTVYAGERIGLLATLAWVITTVSFLGASIIWTEQSLDHTANLMHAKLFLPTLVPAILTHFLLSSKK